MDMKEDDIRLEIGALDQDPLVLNKDFIIGKDEDGEGIILKLLSNRRWVDLSGRSPPVALVLKKFSTKSSDKNLLPAGDPVIIANVLGTPSVDENDETLYSKASNELRINGTGFMGAKKVDFFFQASFSERSCI